MFETLAELLVALIIVAIVSVMFLVYSAYCEYAAKNKRKESLILKYGDQNIVNKIIEGYFWQGQTEEQLLDSLGRPEDVDQRVMQSKTKEVWKYKPTGKNRYGLKITVENGEVVGWDKKT